MKATYEAIELKESSSSSPPTWSTGSRNGRLVVADGNKDINNVKVPLAYMREHGTLLYTSVGQNIEDKLP